MSPATAVQTVEFRCDRCGEKERAKETELTREGLPKGWRAGVGDYCPKCVKAYFAGLAAIARERPL